MASNSWRRLVLGALFVMAPALAQQANNGGAPGQVPTAASPAPVGRTPAGVRTVDEMDRIQSELIVAQARRQLVEAQKALMQAQGGVTGQDVHLVPVVAGVFGPQAEPYARFLLGAGAEAIGRPGDILPGDFQVVSVSVEKVVIKDRSGRQMIARFSPTAPSASPAPGSPDPGAVR